jgi:CRISPR type III-A-associated RAMP protein Csm4
VERAVLVRLRPRGPWRYGPGDGSRDRVDTLYRSDRLYSAVTLAMAQLGHLSEWLDITAKASDSAVVFSSLFPYQGETLFVTPPATLWPPPANLVSTPSPVFLAKLRWTAARFVPVNLVESILSGQNILADQWLPDAESGCLLRRDRPSSSPFRTVVRTTAAVDRVTRSAVHVDSTACVEFEPGSGLWAVAKFASPEAESAWSERVKAAFRLLADSGFGGRRKSGWGQAEAPQFQEGNWPSVLMPKLGRLANNGTETEPSLYWLLSLYAPGSQDAIDWRSGEYKITTRGGRVESSAEKKLLRMVSEGSVLAAQSEPAGAAVDVAPDGFAHPVYRFGFALTVKLPKLEPRAEQAGPVEMAADKEAPEGKPCEEPLPSGGRSVEEAGVEGTSEAQAWTQAEPEAAVREEPENQEPGHEV